MNGLQELRNRILVTITITKKHEKLKLKIFFVCVIRYILLLLLRSFFITLFINKIGNI